LPIAPSVHQNTIKILVYVETGQRHSDAARERHALMMSALTRARESSTRERFTWHGHLCDLRQRSKVRTQWPRAKRAARSFACSVHTRAQSDDD